MFEPGLPEKMFKLGHDHIMKMKDTIIKNFKPNTFFFLEYLQKPKHNTLKYNTVPKNNLVLFDVMSLSDFESWSTGRGELCDVAGILDVDVVPELHRGKADIDKLKELLGVDSYLGGEKIEGVVVKNYSQTVNIGGKNYPVFSKYVREEFKERHGNDWKVRSPKTSLVDWVNGFCSEARWNKAIQHLTEFGMIEESPKDIGAILKEVQEDITIEEGGYIRDFLFKHFIDDIKRASVRGLPQWYKDKLVSDNVLHVKVD